MKTNMRRGRTRSRAAKLCTIFEESENESDASTKDVSSDDLGMDNTLSGSSSPDVSPSFSNLCRRNGGGKDVDFSIGNAVHPSSTNVEIMTAPTLKSCVVRHSRIGRPDNLWRCLENQAGGIVESRRPLSRRSTRQEEEAKLTGPTKEAALQKDSDDESDEFFCSSVPLETDGLNSYNWECLRTTVESQCRGILLFQAGQGVADDEGGLPRIIVEGFGKRHFERAVALTKAFVDGLKLHDNVPATTVILSF